ncbi:MAG TPA: folate family ECF transporter S component [Bacillota bacterium]|nr:folate family ECF transporter S component [Bacillota bacterium]HPF42251.1 folate family ECF transporter S component [Bacillota bacterium]HPJ85727.1 folate family ECF transporter S component [Bacillota bacterium]HPQ61636.1 folate family ECF transporter S component [Bacillota bacterium]HRX91543.1 folate family ECF transporter S component [Candidatus Izemoplasmatales bacterium]
MHNKNIRNLVFTGLMVAIGVVLAQFLSIYIPNASEPIIKFGIGYLPLIMASIIAGPVYGLMAGIAQDLLGFFIFGGPSGQTFFPGFTLNAALYGFLPGIIYRIRKNSGTKLFFWLNLVLAVLLFLGSFWYFLHVDQVISSTLTDNQKLLLAGIGLIGTVFLVVFDILVYKSKKYGDEGTKILFIISLMYVLTSLILTPIWLYIMNPGISFFVRIPLRIVKMPIEVSFYVILVSVLLEALGITKRKLGPGSK